MASTVTRDHHLLTRNLKLNGNYISNDGDDEGISMTDGGEITLDGLFVTIEGERGLLFREGGDNILSIDNARNISTTNTAAIDLDCSGSFSLNSTGGALNIGNDDVAQAINIGTGAAARTITIGNDTGATAVAITSGTGDITMSSEDRMTLSSASVMLINAASTLSIGSDDVDQIINIGSSGERTLNIGNAQGATAVNIAAGTGGIDISTTATTADGIDITANSVTTGNVIDIDAIL